MTPDPTTQQPLTGAGANTTTTTSQTSISNTTPPAVTNPATGQPQPYSQTPVDPQAPSTSSPPQNIAFEAVLRDSDQINNNPLNGYIDVIYNISLAMVSWEGAGQLRGSSFKGDLSAEQYLIFASTADASTDKTRYHGDYYNIKNYTFTSFVGHIPQNPMVAIAFDGKMKIFQPYGFSLREDLGELSHQLGYKLKNPLDFVYRLEIWFSGYKPTGEWVPRIPFGIHTNRNSSTSSVVYYCSITTCEARVTSNGTEYDLSLQPVSHLAQRAEVIVMHCDQHGAISKTVNVSYEAGNKFGDFIQRLVLALHNQVYFDTQGWLNVEYEFIGPDWLFDAPFSAAGKIDFHSGVTYNDDSGSYVFSGNNVDIFTLLNHVMNALPLVRQLHLREDDPDFKQPGCLWNIRTNISVIEHDDHTVNGFRRYKYQYFIEPVLSFRARLTEVPDRNRRVSYANQLARAKAMRGSGMLVRVYDYFFTNANSEVVDFQFMFKNFYYESYPYEDVDAEKRVLGFGSDNDNVQKQESENTQTVAKFNNDTFTTIPSLILQATNSGDDLGQVLGIPTPPSGSVTGGADPAMIHQGCNRSPTTPASQNLGTSEFKTQKYLKSKDQYMRFDMVNAQITVRLDPTWLMNPYMSGGDFTSPLPVDQGTSDLNVNVDRVVFIRAYRPNQKNFMNPDFANTAPMSAPILGGFYQVIYVISEFINGRFVQKLNMFKYPHLNYFNTMGDNASPTIQPGNLAESVNQATSSVAAVGDQQDPNSPNPLSGGTF